jgi:glycosyltransferase involved in cell wall biosynthesis
LNGLSVVIPTKNRPLLLRRALRSFTSATGRLEIVVVDDGSSAEIAASNQEACAALINCRYERLEASRGAPAARNHGLRLSQGAYVWFMDDDDYATERTVHDVLADVAERNGAQVLLMPRSVILDNTTIERDVPADEADKFERYRQRGIEVTTSCVLFPRSILLALGGWDEKLLALQDTDLLLRAAAITTFARLRTEPVRVDTSAPDRITYAFCDSQLGKLQFLRKHWGLLPLRRRLRYIAQVLSCSPLLRALRLRRKMRLASQPLPSARLAAATSDDEPPAPALSSARSPRAAGDPGCRARSPG